ncbi:restriction endonuclease [Photobacterium leiognathi]|uniref:restriction endonuclease n=1 Tax=Photobacterium leiognathi TaxID=553611 RepID=UPI002981646D|nr:restriction endonuclease [Photobacterium leiognathi]
MLENFQSFNLTNKILILSFIMLIIGLIIQNLRARKLSKSHYIKQRIANKTIKYINKHWNDISPGGLIQLLRGTDPYAFEIITLKALNEQPKVRKIFYSPSFSCDGGIDGRIRLKNKSKNTLIQVKRYSNHIKKQHVIDFINVCKNHNTEGYFIHTGKTSKHTKELLKHSRVKLISGDNIYKLLSNLIIGTKHDIL